MNTLACSFGVMFVKGMFVFFCAGEKNVGIFGETFGLKAFLWGLFSSRF